MLTYYLAIADETPKQIVATASGSDHLAQLAAADSGWTPGTYRWTARVAKGADRYTVGSGVLEVLPDPTAATDRRTHAEKCLLAITACLEKRVGDSITEYEIDGVKAKHIAPDQLLKLRAYYLAVVRRERGGPTARLIPVRFSHV